MRRAARTDANQQGIVDALQAIGAVVWVIGLPLDLLVGYRGATVLLECKTLTGKREPKPNRKTKLQIKFFAEWRGGPAATVTDVEGAIRAVMVAGKTDDEIERLRIGHERYETARRMSPQQWLDAWVLNKRTGKPFDEIIDQLLPFRIDQSQL